MRQAASRAKRRFALTSCDGRHSGDEGDGAGGASWVRRAPWCSPRDWPGRRSIFSTRRRAFPAAPPRMRMARSARAAGARCASSSGPIANASARRSSTTSARASSRRKQWPIRLRSREPGRWRGSRTDRRARSPIGSNIQTARSLPDRSLSWMARAGADLLAEADLLVPVPLHPLRLWRRRFNQAAVLAREVSRLSGKRCDVGAILRVKATAQPDRPQPRAAGGERPGRVSRRRRRAGPRPQRRADR